MFTALLSFFPRPERSNTTDDELMRKVIKLSMILLGSPRHNPLYCSWGDYHFKEHCPGSYSRVTEMGPCNTIDTRKIVREMCVLILTVLTYFDPLLYKEFELIIGATRKIFIFITIMINLVFNNYCCLYNHQCQHFFSTFINFHNPCLYLCDYMTLPRFIHLFIYFFIVYTCCKLTYN